MNDGQVAEASLLNVEDWRSFARIEDLIVGRRFRRYGIGSLLLNCSCDWARNNGCWAILLETQNVNYPAIQSYLRNRLQACNLPQPFHPPPSLHNHLTTFFANKHPTP